MKNIDFIQEAGLVLETGLGSAWTVLYRLS